MGKKKKTTGKLRQRKFIHKYKNHLLKFGLFPLRGAMCICACEAPLESIFLKTIRKLQAYCSWYFETATIHSPENISTIKQMTVEDFILIIILLNGHDISCLINPLWLNVEAIFNFVPLWSKVCETSLELGMVFLPTITAFRKLRQEEEEFKDCLAYIMRFWYKENTLKYKDNILGLYT